MPGIEVWVILTIFIIFNFLSQRLIFLQFHDYISTYAFSTLKLKHISAIQFGLQNIKKRPFEAIFH